MAWLPTSDWDRLRLQSQTIIKVDMTTSTPPTVPAAMATLWDGLWEVESAGRAEALPGVDEDGETIKVDKRVTVVVEVAVMLGATNNPGLLNRDERSVQRIVEKHILGSNG